MAYVIWIHCHCFPQNVPWELASNVIRIDHRCRRPQQCKQRRWHAIKPSQPVRDNNQDINPTQRPIMIAFTQDIAAVNLKITWKPQLGRVKCQGQRLYYAALEEQKIVKENSIPIVFRRALAGVLVFALFWMLHYGFIIAQLCFANAKEVIFQFFFFYSVDLRYDRKTALNRLWEMLNMSALCVVDFYTICTQFNRHCGDIRLKQQTKIS